VSTRPDGAYGIDDVCLSIPCVVGLEGVEKRVDPELSDEEQEALQASAEALYESRRGLHVEP
jgi:L-lactate dehydrogenase